MSGTERFNLRVYALVFRENEILLVDEDINGFKFTKFPGGGVELGEGIQDALKREMREEAEIEIHSLRHFYTCDFYQESAFNPKEQIIAVYYVAEASIPWQNKDNDQSSLGKSHHLHLYFKSLDELKKEDLTFPIDRHVFELLMKQKGE